MTTVALAARAYQQSFDTRPYTTLAFTNGTLSALGDAVAQAAQLLVSVHYTYQAHSTILIFNN